jgi:two-component system NtrC family sensor kinase
MGKPISLLLPQSLRKEHLRGFEAFSLRDDQTVFGRTVPGVGLRKDGTEFPLELSLSQWSAGGAPAVNAIIRDVSDREAARGKLERLTHQYELLLNSAGEGIVGLDRDGRITFVNPAALSMTGWRREEVLGRPYDHVFPTRGSRDEAGIGVNWLKWVQSGTGTTEESVYLRRDGSPFPVNVSCTPMFEGPEVAGAVVIFEDITERRKAESALRRSEEKYRGLVEHAAFGIYRSSPKGEFLAVNPALVEILGYDSEEELMGVDLSEDVYVDPEERARLIQEYSSRRRIEGVEVRWRRKDGIEIEVRLSGRPSFDPIGRAESFEMIVEDVTERKKLEAQLRQAQKMEAVGQLTGGIAHDFNNELSVILMNAELAARGLERGQPVELSDLLEIRTAAERASEMTRQLLGFSRQAELRMVPVDLHQVVGNLSRVIRAVLPEDVEIRTFAEESLPPITADPGAIEQILLNLVTNARDAMPEGGRLTIEAKALTLGEPFITNHPYMNPGSYVSLEVTDTGTGMDEGTKRRVFEPFFTTKPSGLGTGLGMAMVYGLTKQQGGFVHLYSEPGVGTTIRLHFPATGGTAESIGPRETTPEVEGGREKILVVEDEPAVRAVAKRALETVGYRVVTAASGDEGLAIFRDQEGELDLILSDLVMPGLSGGDLYKTLRDEGHPVKFILASGYTGRDTKEREALDPNVPFVQKPWHLANLLQTIRDVLDSDGEDCGPTR